MCPAALGLALSQQPWTRSSRPHVVRHSRLWAKACWARLEMGGELTPPAALRSAAASIGFVGSVCNNVQKYFHAWPTPH